MARDASQDEAIQIAHVQDDLIREFPMLPAATVRSHVQQVERTYAGARVRSFIPVLVGRGARQRLRHLV